MIAGPSEVLILADAGNDPDWLALDLLAQAEHDAAAQAILSPTTPASAAAVAAAVEARLADARRAARSPAASWRDYGAVITVRDWDEAVALADRIAPEHLQICTADAEALAGAGPPCRRHLPRRADARGDRRLRRRPEPRAADRALGALLLRPLGARLHEAHDHRPDDARPRSPRSARRPSGWPRAEGLEAHGLSVRARLDRLNEG